MMAHELAHMKNRDTLIMTITATIAGAISMLANSACSSAAATATTTPLGLIGTLAMVILAPLAAMMVQMAISRTREYSADSWAPRSAASRPRLPRPGEDLQRRASDPERERRAQSGDRASVHHQSPVGPAHGQPVLDPSRDREPHRGAQGLAARWAQSGFGAPARARTVRQRLALCRRDAGRGPVVAAAIAPAAAAGAEAANPQAEDSPPPLLRRSEGAWLNPLRNLRPIAGPARAADRRCPS